jgi:hypothetical protein
MESLSRVYAPHEFSVWLSPRDRAKYEGVEQEVIGELCAYLLEHARREDLIMVSPPRIAFHTDERLALGEFGIQPEPVRIKEPGERPRPAPEQESPPPPAPAVAVTVSPPPPPAPSPPRPTHPPAPSEPAEAAAPVATGETMIYSTSARVRGPLEEAQARRPTPRAMLAVGTRRLLLPGTGGTVGRSRDCDVVLEDAGISRRHAEIRPSGEGWTITDLKSTNGVIVNGRALSGPQALKHGDRIELGSTQITFEVR